MRPSPAKANARPGGLPGISKTGLGVWHGLVLVWTLGATDTGNLVDPFAHLAVRVIRAGRL